MKRMPYTTYTKTYKEALQHGAADETRGMKALAQVPIGPDSNNVLPSHHEDYKSRERKQNFS